MTSKENNLDLILVSLTPDQEHYANRTQHCSSSNKSVIIFSPGYNPGKLPRGGGLARGVGFRKGNLGGKAEHPMDHIPIHIGRMA